MDKRRVRRRRPQTSYRARGRLQRPGSNRWVDRVTLAGAAARLQVSAAANFMILWPTEVMVGMGFSPEEIKDSLLNQKYNEVTATYLLLGRKGDVSFILSPHQPSHGVRDWWWSVYASGEGQWHPVECTTPTQGRHGEDKQRVGDTNHPDVLSNGVNINLMF